MSYAKTLPPILPNLYKRTRLFDVLDQHRDRQVIWIQGQAGAGKTTLATSYIEQCGLQHLWYRLDGGDNDPATFFYYFSLAAEGLLSEQYRTLPILTPESLTNLIPFVVQYFRKLFRMLPKPLLLVFDNFQALAVDSLFQEIIVVALREIPRGITAIVLSRSPPPGSLSRMQVNRTMAVLDHNDLRFNYEEVLGLAQLWLPGEIHVETIQRMNEMVDGWVAGLVLLLERGGHDGSATDLDKEFFFSYFANEIFDRLSVDKQRFLLHTACLETMTSPVARELTGMVAAQDILERLCERHYFTSKSDRTEPVYQYHPLFKDFLLNRGKNDLGSKNWQQLCSKAALILAGNGELEEAIELACGGADWLLMAELINRQAPVMLAQQRLQMLEKWLKKLPRHVVKTSPWLLYWYGCCRRPFDQQESGSHFVSAYTGFKDQQQQKGMLLAASGVILSIITEWDNFRSLDPWLEVLIELVDNSTDYPSPDVEAMVVLAMLGGLLFRMPQHPMMARWEAHGGRLLRESKLDISLRMDIGNMLVHWQYWKGDLAAATHSTDILVQLVESGGSVTLPRLCSAMNHAIHNWHVADFDRCLAAIDSGLELAAEMGIHIMDDRLLAQSVYASLSRDDLANADRFLDRMKPILQHSRRLAISQYHYLSSNYHLIAGDLELARQHCQNAVDINREVGTPFPEALAGITLAQIHFELGEKELAVNLLEKANGSAKGMQSRTLELLYELTSAWFSLIEQQKEAAHGHLRRGMTMQSKMGFINIPGWRCSMMKPLLLEALENDIEPEFVKRLIYKHDLHTDAPPQANERWPWPVKITTLGCFSLLIDGQPLQYSTKSQQKPLELLKALIANGGREVGKSRLIDGLWPDTDGDKAIRALDTTLHRLRKLARYEQAVLVKDRKLSLNSKLCWVDTWALEGVLEQTEVLAGHAAQSDSQALRLKRQMIALYKGHFLHDDDEPSCIISYRERLFNRFLDRLGQLADYWEKRSDWHEAQHIYQHILELDGRLERFYQRLMICYRQQGRIAEAMATYERCRKALSLHYGIEPSSTTESLYRSLHR